MLEYGGIPAVDDEANLEKVYCKVDKVGGFLKTGKVDESLGRYIPNILLVMRQNQIVGSIPRKAFASVTYSDMKTLEFVLELTANTYSNYSSMELVLPIQFTKKPAKTTQMDADTITVNNFFEHWITDIDIRQYPDNARILPTNNNVNVYQFSASQLKYLPNNSVEPVLKTLLYSNKPVYLDENADRIPNNDDNAGKRSNDNLTYRINELKDWIFKKNYYRIPLGVLVDLGLVNSAIKTDTKFLFTFQRNMNKLFETTKNGAASPDEPDALIQFHDWPYISYQELNLTKTFDIYFSGILRAEIALRMGVLRGSYQQLFETNKGIQSLPVTFKGAQRQFEWLEISLVYNKYYQHLTIYDSYDLELAAKMVQSIKFENTTSTYSLTGKLEYN